MDKEGASANMENFFGVFRCTTEKHAETFLSEGEIKFNTPNYWVKCAFEKGEGRGDKLEGTMATFNMFDIEHTIELNEKYKKYLDLMRISIDQRVYLKRARDMELPCFCFYILKESMFKCSNKEGKYKLTTTVPASYFRDFMDNLDPCEVDKLDQKDKPAVIFVENYQKFKQKIVSTLVGLGVKREEIIITSVEYFDFEKSGQYGWWDFGQKSPIELAIKNIRFKSQSEARIIVNTDDVRIKRILEKPIKVGTLKDIAKVSNRYLHSGMLIELTPRLLD